ncbi:MAG: phosphotriesterase-related protein [Alphaproteobacteria bacterium]
MTMVDPDGKVGVGSGHVMTVLGPLPVARMGVTLVHEHILLDAATSWRRPCCAGHLALAERPVSVEFLGELRMNPFLNRDNCVLSDVDAAIEELMAFADQGGATVIDPTNRGIGRDGPTLQRISRRTGLNIVMGAGFYLERSHPDYFAAMSEDDIADQIVADVGAGPDLPEVPAGLIGEIGVSKDFTAAEEKSLRGAAQAARRSGVPLSIHLPGWERLAHRVLDVVEAVGADLDHTILCHMNPSCADPAYQKSLADRGAWLEYDMIGMDYYYADQDAQCPSDEDNARAIRALIDDGYLRRLLISQDVFLKMMLTRHGGFGYGYILRHFVPRLRRHGVDRQAIDALLTGNPRRVFSADPDAD